MTITKSWEEVEQRIREEYGLLDERVIAAIATAHHLGYKNGVIQQRREQQHRPL